MAERKAGFVKGLVIAVANDRSELIATTLHSGQRYRFHIFPSELGAVNMRVWISRDGRQIERREGGLKY